MKRNLLRYALVTSLLAPALIANPRTPRGIYAMVGIAQYEKTYLDTHPSVSSVPSDYFSGTVYPELLANPGSRSTCTGPGSTRILLRLRHSPFLEDPFNTTGLCLMTYSTRSRRTTPQIRPIRRSNWS